MNASDGTVHGLSLFAATRVAAPDRPRLTFDLDVDVCVIGAGLAGLTTAREVARRGCSVVVLEAHRIAWNASGRNTGFVLPGFAQSPRRVIERVGAKRARELWALSQLGVDYVRDAIRQTQMPGVVPISGWLTVSKTDDSESLQAETALLREGLGMDIDFWPTELVRTQLKSRRYFQAIHFPNAFHIHSLNYALGLAAAAEQAGARIFEDTPALSIDPTGIRKRVVTPNARVRAAHIVLAGNTHLAALAPKLARTLVPITTYTVATAPLGERLAEAMVYRGGVSDGRWVDNHYRATEDGRLIWLGRMTTWQADAKHYTRTLRADIRRTYPQLGKIKIEYVWSGTGGTPVHLMPQIGEVGSGLWIASGFDGHGFNTTALAGTLIARAIIEGDQTWTLFKPFELVWAGGAFGRAIVQTSYWVSRRKAKLAGFISRRRESARLRAAANAASLEKKQLTHLAKEVATIHPILAAIAGWGRRSPSGPIPSVVPAASDMHGGEAPGEGPAKKRKRPRSRRGGGSAQRKPKDATIDAVESE
jgi:gamma-glutamylputrescine oxidase